MCLEQFLPGTLSAVLCQPLLSLSSSWNYCYQQFKTPLFTFSNSLPISSSPSLSGKTLILFQSNCTLYMHLESKGKIHQNKQVWFKFKLVTVNFKLALMLPKNPLTCPTFIPPLFHTSPFSETWNACPHAHILRQWGNVSYQKRTSQNSYSYIPQPLWVYPHCLASLLSFWMDSQCPYFDRAPLIQSLVS